jgi:hypothetical protein
LVYICIAIEAAIIKKRGFWSINWLKPAKLSCLGSKRHMFNDLRWEVIVPFVDIGGNHHCLNILFIIHWGGAMYIYKYHL